MLTDSKPRLGSGCKFQLTFYGLWLQYQSGFLKLFAGLFKFVLYVQHQWPV